MEGQGLHVTEAVIDNGKFGSHTIRFEAGLLAQQAQVVTHLLAALLDDLVGLGCGGPWARLEVGRRLAGDDAGHAGRRDDEARLAEVVWAWEQIKSSRSFQD